MGKYVLLIHGGAVNTDPSTIPPEKEAKLKEGLEQALQAGWEILNRGGTALDAVEAAVMSMEDNELFNAGRGGMFNINGDVETESSIMDGFTLRGGAVSGLKLVKNPVRLARLVMEKCKHTFLTADGAHEFALSQGLTLQDPSYFKTDQQRQEWLEILQQAEVEHAGKHDTVGAVALDQHGNLAVATSTGGIEGKLRGRVGDSCIYGGGSYANNEVCAASCTGDGEIIMLAACAHEVYALCKYKKLTITKAAREAVGMYADKLAGDRGIIALDPEGNIAIESNTNVFRRAYRVEEEELFIDIWMDKE
ncbi:isoaspartyl peptidase/L-asparaginase [Hymenobacter sp. BT770]|uniref:isoaspartyl peptidase/L-asparaginase family protein n=1 Tax=Hymenobacter sp. BT770 TaxID=2886942 RepID=UPI001D111EFE|nr:isoaspartyl peptidase/L-asparaginase [Hymenobacter sp. BT770]MCC3152552.1 isoaspartyl peptidase/L-asparaginase [Hymenobacter sp. BT770]MDO3414471.1 isoaspartyl peptidase/L-asparaginase [Hymenobacter sp. BT770]